MKKVSKIKAERRRGEKYTGRLELRGSKWLAIWCIGGKRFSKSTGTADRAEAERWLENELYTSRKAFLLKQNADKKANFVEQMKAVCKGQLAEIAEERDRIESMRPKILMSQIWETFATHPNRNTVAKNTDYQQRFTLNSFLEWLAANHPEVHEIGDVSDSIALDYASVLKGHYTAGGYNNALSTLRHIWNLVGQKVKLKENPFGRDKISRMRGATDSRRRAFTEEELRVVFAEAAKTVPPLERLLVVMTFTGLRLGDAACLRWEDVDLDRGFVSLIPKKVRRFGEKARVAVPIMPPLRTMLERTPADKRSGHVMPDMAKCYESGSLSGMVSRFLRDKCKFVTRTEADVSGHAHTVLSAHCFRHTFVSMAANAGIPFPVVQRIVGHTSETMSLRYYHSDERATKKAFESFPTLQLVPDAAHDTVDAVATVRPLTRIEELRRMAKAIVEGGDADEIATAREVLADALGEKAR